MTSEASPSRPVLLVSGDDELMVLHHEGRNQNPHAGQTRRKPQELPIACPQPPVAARKAQA
jgi:hypothetical protein